MGVNDFIQVGSRIKEARLNHKPKISQKEMARLLEIPVPTYSGYENNHREPNRDTIEKIAEILGVSVESLMGISERKYIDLFTGGSAANKIFLKNAEEILNKRLAELGLEAQDITKDIARSTTEMMKTLGQSTVDNLQDILEPYSKLNDKGKQKAVEYTNDLTQIDEYTKK
ncbi:helix-turn-helix domain-containing protein [Anaerotignum sp.]